MELKIINETVDAREIIFEGTPEQGFECDILLPDYCPDVRRILKCHVTPKVSQCYQNGDKANIDGFIFIKIYYLCDENKIHCYDSRLPFSKVLELKDGVDGVSVSVGAKTDYVNCRAVNQRRFDIRGAVSLSARITGKVSENVVSDAVGGGIQLRKKTVSGCTLCAEVNTQFSVQEEETVSGSPVNAVLRSDACAVITETKLIPNKAILKGELRITTLYTDAQATTSETVVHTFPISRIMDIDGITSDSLVEIKTDVVSIETLPKQDESGEFTKLSFDVKVNIFAKAFENKEITFATDAYSTLFDCDFYSKKVSIEHIDKVIDETFTYKSQIELSNVGVDRVIDLWTCAKNPVTRVENSRFVTEIPVDVFTFFVQEDGSAEFCEKNITATFESSLSDVCENIAFEPDVKILSCDYSLLAPNKVELRLELKLVGAVICKETDRCICELNIDENRPKALESTPALTIYYCDKGEDVWSIAKRYNTCADCIMAENDLDCETVEESRVILIPSSN